MTESPRSTPNSGSTAVERSTSAATAGPGSPGGTEGPVQRTGGEPDLEAQHSSALMAQDTQLAITSSVAGKEVPNVLDPEGKINSGQVRSGLKRNDARHSAFRPYER
jgi:hypothetical protein